MSRPQKVHVSDNNELISTREALLRATLKLIEEKSFDAISLREVTRSAGVSPAAFYRHFDNMQHLGLTIVEDAFSILRVGLKEVRTITEPRALIGFRSVQCLNSFGINHPQHYRFICSGHSGGATTIREAIQDNWKILRKDLEEDLADTPELSHLSTKSLAMIADLMTTTMMRVGSDILIGSTTDEEREAVIERGTHQLRLIILGASQWKDKPEENS